MSDQTRGDDRVTVAFGGELDMAVAAEIQHRITTAGRAAQSVILDFSDVTFFDSSALRAVVNAHRALTQRGVEVALGGTSDIVARVLTVTGVRVTFDGESD
jgi:anti-sigma B factor antagonist